MSLLEQLILYCSSNRIFYSLIDGQNTNLNMVPYNRSLYLPKYTFQKSKTNNLSKSHQMRQKISKFNQILHKILQKNFFSFVFNLNDHKYSKALIKIYNIFLTYQKYAFCIIKSYFNIDQNPKIQSICEQQQICQIQLQSLINKKVNYRNLGYAKPICLFNDRSFKPITLQNFYHHGIMLHQNEFSLLNKMQRDNFCHQPSQICDSSNLFIELNYLDQILSQQRIDTNLPQLPDYNSNKKLKRIIIKRSQKTLQENQLDFTLKVESLKQSPKCNKCTKNKFEDISIPIKLQIKVKAAPFIRKYFNNSHLSDNYLKIKKKNHCQVLIHDNQTYLQTDNHESFPSPLSICQKKRNFFNKKIKGNSSINQLTISKSTLNNSCQQMKQNKKRSLTYQRKGNQLPNTKTINKNYFQHKRTNSRYSQKSKENLKKRNFFI